MTTTTAAEIAAHREHGSWRKLEEAALAIIANVQSSLGGMFQTRLGGGTRLMLALNHRISDDVDLFIRDPQLLGYITPRLNDSVQALAADYEEAADYLKLRFPEGEIDFIVRGSLLDLPDETSPDTVLRLEPVAEVLAKKLFYRGAMLTPRDLFDWWAIGNLQSNWIPEAQFGHLLAKKQDGLRHALAMLPASSAANTMWGNIRAPDLPPMKAALTWASAALDTYHLAAQAHPRVLEANDPGESSTSKPR